MQHVLLIGAGTMGKEHASAYHLMKNVKLEGIVDLNKEQAEKSDYQRKLGFFSHWKMRYKT